MISETNYLEVLTNHGIPDHMHAGIYRYIFDRVMPGSFLQAVFANDLVGAMSSADDINRAALQSYCSLMYMDLPGRNTGLVWGSYDAVQAWVDRADEQTEEES